MNSQGQQKRPKDITRRWAYRCGANPQLGPIEPERSHAAETNRPSLLHTRAPCLPHRLGLPQAVYAEEYTQCALQREKRAIGPPLSGYPAKASSACSNDFISPKTGAETEPIRLFCSSTTARTCQVTCVLPGEVDSRGLCVRKHVPDRRPPPAAQANRQRNMIPLNPRRAFRFYRRRYVLLWPLATYVLHHTSYIHESLLSL